MIPVEKIAGGTLGNLLYYVAIIGVLLVICTIIRLKVSFLRKAFIPKSMFPAVFSALNVIRDIRFGCQKSDRASFIHKVIERILSISSTSEELSEDDVNYLISKIS